jgi:hypothetical protein
MTVETMRTRAGAPALRAGRGSSPRFFRLGEAGRRLAGSGDHGKNHPGIQPRPRTFSAQSASDSRSASLKIAPRRVSGRKGLV